MMDEKGVSLLETLQTVFPHFVTTTRKDGSVVRRSVWCTEKAHSIKHGGSNYRSAGRCRNYSTNTLETGHKFSVRAVAHKTNNQARVGGSILEASIQREAAESLASQIDRTGACPSCWKWCTLLANFLHPRHTLCTLCAYCAYLLPGVHTLCTLCAYCDALHKKYAWYAQVSTKCTLAVKSTHQVH